MAADPDEDSDPAGPDTAGAEADEKADTATELRVRAGKMTVWLDRATSFSMVAGEPEVVMRGRASRNLDSAFSFVPDDAFGEAAVTSARSFEVRLHGGHEINSILSGLPLLVSLVAPSDPTHQYTVQINLRPAFTKFDGSSSLFVVAPTHPIYIGESAEDPLRYATKVATSSSLLAIDGVNAVIAPATGGFTVDLTYTDLEAVLRANQRVTFRGADGATKRASLENRSVAIALTTKDPYEAFPAPVCTPERFACFQSHSGRDLAACGEFRQVRVCQFAPPQ